MAPAARLTEASRGSLLQIPGLVNVDFADVRTIMSNAGTSLMGQGCASGKGRAREAALQVGLGCRMAADDSKLFSVPAKIAPEWKAA